MRSPGTVFASHVRSAIATLGPGAARAGVVGGLDEILLIGACVAFAAAIATLLLVRERDFVASIEEAELPGPAAVAA